MSSDNGGFTSILAFWGGGAGSGLGSRGPWGLGSGCWGSTAGGTEDLGDELLLGVNEGEERSGDDLGGGTVPNVVDEGLSVGGYPDGNGAVDLRGKSC